MNTPTDNLYDLSENVRILWINPLYTDVYNRAMADSFRQIVRPGTEVDVVSLDGEGPSHVEYNAFEALMLPQLLRTVRWAEEEGYDATVIGCFYDPALRAAREITDRMVVVGPAHSALSIAGSLGERFSILVGRKKWIPEMAENIHRCGASERLASWRVLEMGVDDFQENPALTEERIMSEARKAVEQDGADVVILGCTAEFGFFRTVQEEIGVPVIDATVAPLKHAEQLVDSVRRFGWTHSKRLGYDGPTVQERQRFFPALEPKHMVSMTTVSS
ncbi:aspartate/glutamate racemase family protein [Arthrobacter sp. PsM3]|uniref:aspartate/glutamate racemase family protein n=1 Tax=Arthrobacter sp. PsM3 TaxID=3030531 RepID=UPI00263B1E3E|nr:aspartate/glutamate racemase family protein [Arthrobacter sp. PsM3]MDN4646001.1 aspartate/glutamate racemase family protein [Arthrobacter sp. PsM3]